MKQKLLLLWLAIMTAITASAYDFSAINDDGVTIYYNILGEKAKVTYQTTSYNSYSGDVVIPESVEYNNKTYSVTEISGSAFSGCSGLTSVTIPDSVTSIYEYAFSGCSSLTSVTIPNSVTSIGSFAFSRCSGLTSVTIGNSVTSIGASAFEGTALYNDGSNWENNVLYIGIYLIKAKNSLKDVYTIKNGTTTIASSAFLDCSGLTSVTIPDSVTRIGQSAFSGCSGLKEVCISDLSAWCAINFSTVNSNPLYYANNLYLNGELVENLVIPSNVETIKNFAFCRCSGLTSVTIPDSVTSIGHEAFEYCSGLTSVTIPNSVTIIGSAAFYKCSGLTAVKISDISAWCAIKFLDYDSNPMYYAHHLYLNDEEITNLVIPDTVPSIVACAFYSCRGLTSVTIPNSVTSIGESAFYNCRGLTSVTIGNSVTEIGSSAFANCSGLSEVRMAETAESLATDAFSGVTAMFYLADETPGTYVFQNCMIFVAETALEAYRAAWPDHASEIFAEDSSSYDVTVTALQDQSGLVKAITDLEEGEDGNIEALLSVVNLKVSGTINSYDVMVMHNKMLNLANLDLSDATIVGSSYEYYQGYHTENDIVGTRFLCNMGNLQSVKLPNTATTIQADAITEGSPKLKIIEIGSGTQTIEANAFEGITTLTKVVTGNGVTSIGEYAFQNCTGLSQIVFGEGLQTIEDYAFDGCSRLASADLNSSLQLIGNYAFQNCTVLNMEEISVPVIGQYAFSECTNLNPQQITATTIDQYAFNYCTSLNPQQITATTIRACTFKGCSGLVSLNLTSPEGGTLSSYAFQKCTGLKTAEIDTETIGDYIFNGCTSLKSLTFGDKVTTIGQQTCDGCTRLTEVVFGENVQTIGAAAFANCTKLTSVILPEKLTKVNRGTFYRCTALESVVFPPALTEIVASNRSSETYYKGPFENCTSLKKIMLPTALQIIGAYSFTGCSSLEEVRIPSSINTIGDHAFSKTVKDIYTYTIEPTNINQNTFESNLYTDAILHVPATAYKLYFYDTQWSQFINIRQDAGVKYEYFYLTDADLIIDEETPRIEGTEDEETGETKDPNADLGEGSGLVVEGDENQNLGDVNIDSDGENSGSIIGGGTGSGEKPGNIHAKDLKIRIKVKKNKWYFFCFPFPIEIENIEYPGQYVWKYYDGATRAQHGSGGWKTLEETYLRSGKGYIFQGNVDGTLILGVGPAHFHGKDKATTLELHSCEDKANKSWNFIGNPFTSYYSIEDLEFDAPITYWDGTTYQAVRPGDDEYILHPYQAFFVQNQVDDTSEVPFNAGARVTKNQSEDEFFMQDLHNRIGKPKRAPRSLDRKIINVEITDGENVDATRVVFNDESSMEYELATDASKFLATTAPQIYTLGENNIQYSINERPTGDSVVKLGFFAPEAGTFTISATRLDKELELVDLKTGIITNLASDYTFTAVKGTDNDRFILRAPTTGLESVFGSETQQGNAEETYGIDGKRINAENAQGVVIKRNSKGIKKVIVH